MGDRCSFGGVLLTTCSLASDGYGWLDSANDGTVRLRESSACVRSTKKQKLKFLLNQGLLFSKNFTILVYEITYKGSMHVNKENQKNLHFLTN